jgi:hypothetical protein
MSNFRTKAYILFEVLAAIFILAIAFNIYVTGFETRIKAYETIETQYIKERLIDDYTILRAADALDRLNKEHYHPLSIEFDETGVRLQFPDGNIRELKL